MTYYPIICFKCKGDGEIGINPKPTLGGTVYTYIECPICKGLGSILVAEDRLTKVS